MQKFSSIQLFEHTIELQMYETTWHDMTCYVKTWHTIEYFNHHVCQTKIWCCVCYLFGNCCTDWCWFALLLLLKLIALFRLICVCVCVWCLTGLIAATVTFERWRWVCTCSHMLSWFAMTSLRRHHSKTPRNGLSKHRHTTQMVRSWVIECPMVCVWCVTQTFDFSYWSVSCFGSGGHQVWYRRNASCCANRDRQGNNTNLPSLISHLTSHISHLWSTTYLLCFVHFFLYECCSDVGRSERGRLL